MLALSKIYYVYIYFRLDGRPCYIGKGKKKRWLKLHNKHLISIAKKAGSKLPAVIIRNELTEAEAFETEMAFIKAIGREVHGGPLINQTDGGEGVSGHKHTTENREKFRRNATGNTYNNGIPKTEEAKQKMSLAKLGKKQSPEFIKRRTHMMRQQRIEKFADPIRGARHKAGLCGFWITNGEKSRRIPDLSLIPDGWLRGRAKNYKVSNQYITQR